MANNNEDDEFKRAVGEVKPVVNKTAAFERTPVASPVKTDVPAEDAIEFGEEIRYLRPGIQTNTLQKLRRGKFPIEDTLDLHGMTAEDAHIQLRNFLQHGEAAGRRAVRIIHGKGYRSAGRQPILKTTVNQWLQETAAVLAFCSARPENGGTGAVDVLLRQTRKRL